MTLRIALLSDSVLDLIPKLVDSRVDVDLEWYVAPYGWAPPQIAEPLREFGPDVIFWNANAEHSTLPAVTGATTFFRAKTETRAPWCKWNQLANPWWFLDSSEYLLTQMPGDEIEDPRYWYQAKMHYSPKAQELLADLYARAINAYLGKRKKVLVVDLDNTLWRGVLGEDGPTGIGISDDGPDLAFQDAQRAIKAYKDQGVVLAICSKNDEQPATEVLSDHPMMVLRPEDFATWRINWQDKATNLKEIAAELNLGLDSFVFVDDSPHERALVKSVLPEVTVVDLPEDPSYFPRVISRLAYFDSLELTDEDRARPDMYKAEAKRNAAKSESTDLSEYLKSLEIHITVRRANEYDVKRIAQLTQRTNQFNLNGRKYTESDISSNEWWVCESRDKFGDQGLVGAMHHVDPYTVKQWVVSCRALGRGIETAFFETVAKGECLTTIYYDTGRNQVIREWIETEGTKPRQKTASIDWITVEVK